MNYAEFLEEIESAAHDIVAESKEYDSDVDDLAWQFADGHQWVIYTAQAWDLCDMMRRCHSDLFNQAESDFEDCGGCGDNVTADRVMTLIAFHLMHNGVRDAVAELLEEAAA
jgi:hypothetical protein